MNPADFIARFPVRLFHFTDCRNLHSIRQHGGLYPLSMLRENGIAIAAPGGNQWSHDADGLKGVDRFVHLCFFDNHPMEYVARREGRMQTTRFLSINPRVLLHADVRITLDVANKSGVPCLTVPEALDRMDLEAMYTNLDLRIPELQMRRRRVKKYEVLVPAPIAISGI